VKFYVGSLGYEDLSRAHQGTSPMDYFWLKPIGNTSWKLWHNAADFNVYPRYLALPLKLHTFLQTYWMALGGTTGLYLLIITSLDLDERR